MNDPQERSLEEWQKLRRECAVAEQQAASLTHELLREKAKTEQLEAELNARRQAMRRPWWKRMTFGAWIVVVIYLALCVGVVWGALWVVNE